jgi:hypothetical protein
LWKFAFSEIPGALKVSTFQRIHPTDSRLVAVDEAVYVRHRCLVTFAKGMASTSTFEEWRAGFG